MPRKHRAARDRPAPGEAPDRPLGVAPEWASTLEDATVRAVGGERAKAYRCPGCQQLIHPGTPHLVVVRSEDLEGRRHWHTPCWRNELRRLGRT